MMLPGTPDSSTPSGTEIGRGGTSFIESADTGVLGPAASSFDWVSPGERRLSSAEERVGVSKERAVSSRPQLRPDLLKMSLFLFEQEGGDPSGEVAVDPVEQRCPLIEKGIRVCGTSRPLLERCCHLVPQPFEDP